MPRPVFRRRRLLAVAASTALAAVAAVGGTHLASAATAGCSVTYAVSSQWPGGFGANVTVTNLGDPVTAWHLTWNFTAGQTVTQLWNGSFTQSGTQVTVTNASWNGAIATGANAQFGFNGAFTSSNPAPTSFALNGVACTGSTPASAPPTTSPTPPPTTAPPPAPTTPPPPGAAPCDI